MSPDEIQNPEPSPAAAPGRLRSRLGKILVVSAGLNLLLALACWLRFVHREPASASAAHQDSSLPAAAPVSGHIETRTVTFTNVPGLLDWRAVESADYRKYIANLRAVGCPSKTIRDIIVADVNELYEQRFLQTFPPTNRIEYWKPGDPLANLIDETQVAALQDFGREKRELISTLLGGDYSGDMELASIQTKVFMERLLNFLTPEKRNALEELEKKYTAKTLNTMKDSVRGNNESARVVLAERDEELLKILSPEEKFEYDVRRSDASMLLRVGLGDFEVTEQEFRGMFPAMKRYIADAGMLGFIAMVRGDGDPRPETQAARQELLKALKSTFAERRFTELMEGTGWSLGGE